MATLFRTDTRQRTASPVDADMHLREVIEWHFDPATASPFWLAKAKQLDFDPRDDVRTIADLRRFPDFSEELRRVPVEALIPRGAHDDAFEVFDSGGTTGLPKRIVDARSRAQNVDWCSEMLDKHGFPRHVNWLHIGPSGPHVVGRSVRYMAMRRGGRFFTIDMDPRWVKKLITSGQQEIAHDYVEHLMDQVEAVVTTQDIRCVFITPPMIEAVCARPKVYDILAERLEGLLWAGTAASDETLGLLGSLFPNAKVSGWYGNTIMGIAAQRLPEAGDQQPCVFRPYHPGSIVEIVDGETGQLVEYGQRGRVLIHLLFKDAFIPNVMERDTALRITPVSGDSVDGIASVAPAAGRKIVEGVY